MSAVRASTRHHSETDGFGLRQAACTTDSDCYMHSTCDVSLGTCVCNMFSRENFATAVFRMVREVTTVPIFQDYIFVTGGLRTYLKTNAASMLASADTVGL